MECLCGRDLHQQGERFLRDSVKGTGLQKRKRGADERKEKGWIPGRHSKSPTSAVAMETISSSLSFHSDSSQETQGLGWSLKEKERGRETVIGKGGWGVRRRERREQEAGGREFVLSQLRLQSHVGSDRCVMVSCCLSYLKELPDALMVAVLGCEVQRTVS